jgi:hypothetical protein
MEQSGRSETDHLYAVQITYSAYESMALCTVTVTSNRDDLLEVTARVDSYRPQTNVEVLPDTREDAVSNLMRVLARQWMHSWVPVIHADFYPESSSYVLMASLIEEASLHLDITSEGKSIGYGVVAYEAGALHLVKATGMSLSFEYRSRDPMLTLALDVLVPRDVETLG